MLKAPARPTLASLLRRFFADQRRQALRAARRNEAPPVASWTPPMVEALMRSGIPQKLFLRGVVATRRRLHAARPRKAAALGFAQGVFRPEVLETIRQQVFHFVDAANQVTGEKFRELMLQAAEERWDRPRLVEEVGGLFGAGRAEAIALTEESRSVHAGQLWAAKDSRVVRAKRWVVTPGACERCLRIDGLEVWLDEPFAVEGAGPYARVDHPPMHPRCSCGMDEVF